MLKTMTLIAALLLPGAALAQHRGPRAVADAPRFALVLVDAGVHADEHRTRHALRRHEAECHAGTERVADDGIDLADARRDQREVRIPRRLHQIGAMPRQRDARALEAVPDIRRVREAVDQRESHPPSVSANDAHAALLQRVRGGLALGRQRRLRQAEL